MLFSEGGRFRRSKEMTVKSINDGKKRQGFDLFESMCYLLKAWGSYRSKENGLESNY